MAFIITSIAGLSTLLGTIFVFFKFKDKYKIINISLSFAAAIMITVSLFDLIPEGYNLLSSNIPLLILLISINIGIIISMFIDKNIHGNELYRVGVISMIAIIIHNIPEGIATYIACNHDLKLGIPLAIAITLHNIPEGISISLPIYYAEKSRGKAILYTFISGISEIFGALIAMIFLKDIINNYIMGILLGIIAGIMLYIAIYELIPQAIKYKNKKVSIVSFVVGLIIMLISIFITK